VGDRDVEARNAGEAAHDGLTVGGQRADADLAGHHPGVVEAADRTAGASEEFGGPVAQFGFGGVQVHGGCGILGLQVQQAAGMRAQREVRGVQQPDRARRDDGADADREPGSDRAFCLPGDQRHRGEGGRPAAGAADHLVCLQHPTGGGADLRRSVPAGVDACDTAGVAGEDLRAVAFRVRDQAGDQRFGQQVALIREERGSRYWKPQCRLELGCFGRADEASGVSPLGQAPDAGFEFAGACGRQLDVAGRAVPGVAVEVRG
jgi:hypothetical protein